MTGGQIPEMGGTGEARGSNDHKGTSGTDDDMFQKVNS